MTVIVTLQQTDRFPPFSHPHSNQLQLSRSHLCRLALFHLCQQLRPGRLQSGQQLPQSLFIVHRWNSALMTDDLQPFTGRKGRPGPAAALEGLPSDPGGAERCGGGAFVTWPTREKTTLLFYVELPVSFPVSRAASSKSCSDLLN